VVGTISSSTLPRPSLTCSRSKPSLAQLLPLPFKVYEQPVIETKRPAKEADDVVIARGI
jgi:hypothetical protein